MAGCYNQSAPWLYGYGLQEGQVEGRAKHLKETPVTYYNIGVPDEYEIEVRNDLYNVVDYLKMLQTQVEANKFGKDLVLDAPYFKALNVEEHLYKPLVFLAEKDVNGNRPYVDVVTGEPTLKVSPVALNLGEQNFVTSFREYCKAHQDDVLAGKQVYLLRNESKRGWVSLKQTTSILILSYGYWMERSNISPSSTRKVFAILKDWRMIRFNSSSIYRQKWLLSWATLI